VAFNPALPSDRDYLRSLLGDTDDAKPKFGLDEAGYDALLSRLGLTQAALHLINIAMLNLGPEMTVDGDQTMMQNRTYMFYENLKSQIISGEIVLEPSGALAVASSTHLVSPDLEVYKRL
jgi:hypothetical protein